jgi:hypothetical protein
LLEINVINDGVFYEKEYDSFDEKIKKQRRMDRWNEVYFVLWRYLFIPKHADCSISEDSYRIQALFVFSLNLFDSR